MKRMLFALLLAATSARADYHVLRHIPIGGEGGWDYVAADGKRLYVSHSDRVNVVDEASGKVVGEITGNLQRVHGIAIAPELGRGFVTSGGNSKVLVFDLATLKPTGEWQTTGENPDAVLYEPSHKRLFTFNGRGKNATVFDATNGKVVVSIDLGGKPEFAVSDRARIFVNIEDTGEVASIDAKSLKVVKRWKLEGCEEPSGLALDAVHARLFSVCGNATMVVSNENGARVAALPIGHGVDGAAFTNGYAFSSNGADGTVTVVHDSKVVATVPTMKSGRTIVADPKTHHLFVPAAKLGPPAAEGQRPTIVPGTFEVIELAP